MKLLSKQFFIFIIISVIYFLTSFNVIIQPVRGYNTLARSLIHGHLNLEVETPPELLTLKNPYNPYKNQDCRVKYHIHDYSLYKGKFYFYYGLIPTILVYIPYQIITHNDLLDNFVVFIFSMLSLFILFKLFLHLRGKYFKNCPEYKATISLITLGLCSSHIILCNRPFMYEVAIATSSFFLLCAIYLLCKNLDSLNNKILILISLFLGLAIGCKVTVLFSCLAIIIYIFYTLKKTSQLNLSKIISLLTPFLAIMLILAIYNFLRFHTPFEFGIKYSLTTVNYQKEPLFSLIYFLRNLKWYFFLPPIFKSTYPYIALNFCQPSTYYPFKESMISFTTIYPIIFIPLLSKLINHRFFTKELFIIYSLAVINLFVLLFYNYTSIRYLTEFVPLFVLGSLITWCMTSSSRKINITSTILIMITIITNSLLFVKIF